MNHTLDSMVYMYGPLLAARMRLQHHHVLAKDPLWLGWRCQVDGCRFFKPAGEFDGVRVLVEWRDEV